MPEGSNERPKPMNLKLTIKASNLTTGKQYKILKFSDITKVTNGKYNIEERNATNNFKQSETGKPTNKPIIFKATSNVYSFDDYILSSDQAIYRGFEI